MRVLVTGAGGQVADALVHLRPASAAVTALGHRELDVGDPAMVERTVRELKPQLIINAAAYTAVDKAEGEPTLAWRVNGEGPGNLARAARSQQARLLHISTDFVFDGVASRPYKPEAPTRPLGAYAESKLAGEQRVREVTDDQAFILRTAWVYAAKGANFVNTMLKLMRERGTVNVVSDQIGSPTWASSVAQALWAAAGRPELHGVYHWTDAGVASWYDFAVAIAEEAQAVGLLKHNAEVNAISTEAYPTPARRPAYSVLDWSASERALGLKPAHWRVNLRKMFSELCHA